MITQSNQRGYAMNIIITIRPVGEMYVSTNNVDDTIIYKETHDIALDSMCEVFGICGEPTDIACDGVDSIYTFKDVH
jgi:hypothetical protein